MVLKYKEIAEFFDSLSPETCTTSEIAKEANYFWKFYDQTVVEKYETSIWTEALKIIRESSKSQTESHSDTKDKTKKLKEHLKKLRFPLESSDFKNFEIFKEKQI